MSGKQTILSRARRRRDGPLALRDTAPHADLRGPLCGSALANLHIISFSINLSSSVTLM